VLISITSCGNCEDKTFQVSDNLLNWLPYSSETPISFSNQDNQTLSYTIIPDETIRIEDDDECTKTSIQPYIDMQSIDQPDFLTIWFNPKEGLSNNQLWAIVHENDQIAGSGSISNINDPDSMTESKSLNGIVFDEVISLNMNGNNSIIKTIYLQKNVGIIGFEYQDSIWVIE